MPTFSNGLGESGKCSALPLPWQCVRSCVANVVLLLVMLKRVVSVDSLDAAPSIEAVCSKERLPSSGPFVRFAFEEIAFEKLLFFNIQKRECLHPQKVHKSVHPVPLLCELGCPKWRGGRPKGGREQLAKWLHRADQGFSGWQRAETIPHKPAGAHIQWAIGIGIFHFLINPNACTAGHGQPKTDGPRNNRMMNGLDWNWTINMNLDLF